MIVVDTNIIGYLYLASELSAQVEIVFHKDPLWAAPLLWRSEFRNVLASYIRKEMLSLDGAQQIMDEATHLMDGREYAVPSNLIFNLVAASTCSAYDCEFVALARDLRVPLVTVDMQVLEQFPDVAISPERFIV